MARRDEGARDVVWAGEMTSLGSSLRYLLPPECYFSPAWHEREQRDLFGATYNLVAYESDLPEPGDYLATHLGNEPLVVVRRGDGSIGAFSTVCRHRGMTIVRGSGHSDGRLRCAYHGWEYGLDGSLERLPQRREQFPDIDTSTLGLPAMRVGTWGGMVFVHPGSDAMRFEDWLGDFGEARNVGAFPWESLVDVARFRVPLACNWKLYVENHIDNYHLWYLHQATLGMYDHTVLENWKSGPHWGGYEPLRPGRERIRGGLLSISGLPAEERQLLRANLLFPNVPMATTDTIVMTYQVTPTGPESCLLDIRVRGEAGSVLERDEDVLTVLRDEDGRACEETQAALRSRHFAVGPLAREHERWIPEFQGDLLEHLRRAGPLPLLDA